MMAQGSHILLVADEVHQLGSQKKRQFLEMDTGKRLGLSATPNRYGDPEGTQALFEYFEGIVQPPFTLYDAIKAKRLVEYLYYPQKVELDADEEDDWNTQSERIRREYARLPSGEGGSKVLSDAFKILLIQRSRIIKKARAKVSLASRIIEKNFELGQRWLVYCEDIEQLKEVLDAIKPLGIPVTKYYSDMEGDGGAALQYLRSRSSILVSIRCLDEGVDIPSVSHALILASSQNPRQFIQRRGRVLRMHEDGDVAKQNATIYDALVIPTSSEDMKIPAFCTTEFARAVEFSKHAFNRGGEAALRSWASELGLLLEEIVEIGVEEEDDDENS